MNTQHHEAEQERRSIQYLLAHSADGARPWPGEASLSALNSVEIRARGWFSEEFALPLHVVLIRLLPFRMVLRSVVQVRLVRKQVRAGREALAKTCSKEARKRHVVMHPAGWTNGRFAPDSSFKSTKDGNVPQQHMRQGTS